MLAFKIIENMYLIPDIYPNSQTFYLAESSLDNRMIPLYIYQYQNLNYITSYQIINNTEYILYLKVWVFSQWIISFNLKKIQLPNITFFAFKDKTQINIYPLSAIIWPPAIKYSKQIITILKKHYQIVKLVKITLENNQVLPFIYNLYQGDLKCDKSQLPIKKIALDNYPSIFIYIKFLIPNLDLNKERVSRSAIKIKNIIRSQFKPYIKDYIYDIIFHVSDNLSHSINMEKSVKKQNKNTQLINVN